LKTPEKVLSAVSEKMSDLRQTSSYTKRERAKADILKKGNTSPNHVNMTNPEVPLKIKRNILNIDGVYST